MNKREAAWSQYRSVLASMLACQSAYEKLRRDIVVDDLYDSAAFLKDTRDVTWAIHKAIDALETLGDYVEFRPEEKVGLLKKLGLKVRNGNDQ
jgi:hypothetical protein